MCFTPRVEIVKQFKRRRKGVSVSFFKDLKALWNKPSSRPEDEVQVLRDIISKVDQLPEDRANYIASFAFLLGRVAYADLKTSKEEVERIEKLIVERFDLDQSQAILICNMAVHQNEMFGATENYLVAREFKAVTTLQERCELIDFLFQVAAADDSISSAEEAEINQMASELEISKDRLVEIRSKYRSQREVFRDGENA